MRFEVLARSTSHILPSRLCSRTPGAAMAGPWMAFYLDADYAENRPWVGGDVLEVVLRDDDYMEQGNGILAVHREKTKGMYECTLIRSQDDYY